LKPERAETRISGLLGALLPPGISAHDHAGPPAGVLLPEEAALVGSGWSDVRRREFATGRQVARVALAKLLPDRMPILKGADGAPVWPPGFCGSITHCAGYYAAAVASTAEWLSIGLDAEVHDTLPDGVLPLIARPEEIEWIEHRRDGRHWDRLLFSIKESIYKAWNPILQCWLDFSDASVRIDPVAGRFTVGIDHARAHLLDGGRRLEGRYLMTPSLILSVALVRREG